LDEQVTGAVIGDYAIENATLRVDKVRLQFKLDEAEKELKDLKQKLDEQGIKLDDEKEGASDATEI